MVIIYILLVGVAVFICGWMLGSNHEMMIHESCRKADHRLAQQLINEQYKRGYKDGYDKAIGDQREP